MLCCWLIVVVVVVQSKRRFERDCKEAERAQLISDKIDVDNKMDGEKVLNPEYRTPKLRPLDHWSSEQLKQFITSKVKTPAQCSIQIRITVTHQMLKSAQLHT